MLFLPYARISFKLLPLSVGREASNTRRHGLLIDVGFHTTLHGVRFCILLNPRIS